MVGKAGFQEKLYINLFVIWIYTSFLGICHLKIGIIMMLEWSSCVLLVINKQLFSGYFRCPNSKFFLEMLVPTHKYTPHNCTLRFLILIKHPLRPWVYIYTLLWHAENAHGLNKYFLPLNTVPASCSGKIIYNLVPIPCLPSFAKQHGHSQVYVN